MAESSKLSKKTDKPPKRKVAPASDVDAAPTPAKKQKKSKGEPTPAPAPEPVEDTPKPSKKPKKSKADAAPELAPIPPPVEALAKPEKSKKSKGEAASEPAPEPTPVEETPQPPKKSKKSSKPVTPSAPAPEPVENNPKPSKKPKKSKADAAEPVPEPAPAPPSVEAAAKKSKKSKGEAAPEPAPEPTPVEEVAQPAKKSKKSSKPVTPPTPESESALDEAGDSSEEEDEPLHGFSTDDDDSSDEDEGYMDVEVSAFDIAKLPTIAKDDATVKRKLENANREPTGDRGVLFLGRIPHGFYEDQLKAYFSQFGTITRLRISRNKKTGQSKHYGFLEFDSSSVAQIVADTMDNYLLMGHIMRCKVIPKAQVHPELWVGANRRWRPVPTVRVAQAEHNKLRTKDEQLRAAHRLLKRQQERQRKLEKAGIAYDFGAAGYKPPKAVEV